MDKNSFIGFLLILLILIGFTWLNKPSREQQQAALEASRQRDSIAHAQAVREAADTLASQQKKDSMAIVSKDTSSLALQYGLFAPFIAGETKYDTLENDLLRIRFTSQGARMVSVELKKFRSSD